MTVTSPTSVLTRPYYTTLATGERRKGFLVNKDGCVHTYEDGTLCLDVGGQDASICQP